MGDLPNWAISIISPICTVVIVGIMGFVIQHIIKRNLEKRDKRNDERLEQETRKQAEYEELRHRKRAEERKVEISDAVNAALTPVVAKLDELDAKINDVKHDLIQDRDATVVQMRVNMMNLHSLYMKQGWADVHQKATWNELYSRYRELGGNHFTEYVDAYKEEIDNLPTTAEKKKTTKKRLVENK